MVDKEDLNCTNSPCNSCAAFVTYIANVQLAQVHSNFHNNILYNLLLPR